MLGNSAKPIAMDMPVNTAIKLPFTGFTTARGILQPVEGTGLAPSTLRVELRK